MNVMVFWYVVYVLACARATRLVRADEISKAFRLRWVKRFGEGSLRTYMIFCAWCISFWLAPVFAAGFLITIGISGWQWLLVVPVSLSISHLVGLLARVEGD